MSIVRDRFFPYNKEETFNKMKPLYRYIIIALLSLVLLLSFSLIKESNKLESQSRALIIVISNNQILPQEIVSLYKNNKSLADILLSFILSAPRQELREMTIQEIAVNYGEEYLAERYKEKAIDYNEVVALTGEQATYDNFKNSLIEAGERNEVVDLLLNMHGDEETILFYHDSGKEVSGITEKEKIAEDLELENLNIGFVYQTICYGKKDIDIWIQAGAKVASGSQGVNYFVLFAPEVFLSNWAKGFTYKEAVEAGYSYELKRFRIIESIFSKDLFDSKSSEIFFIGDENYKIKE